MATTVFAVDVDPRRTGPEPDGPVDTVILAGRGGVDTALEAIQPGGTVVVFADAGAIPAADVYRRELTVVGVAVGGSSADGGGGRAPPRARAADARRSLPLASFDHGLELFRRRDTLKVVFTP